MQLLLPVSDADAAPRKRKGSMLRLLRSPLIALSCLTIAFTCYSFGFFDASLATHLQQVGHFIGSCSVRTFFFFFLVGNPAVSASLVTAYV